MRETWEPCYQRLAGAVRWLGYVAALQIVGFLGVFVKYVSMSLSMGFLSISRLIGRVSMEFSIRERLYFFGEDILLNLVILPAVLAYLAYRLLPRRTAGVAVIGLASGLAVFHFMELLTVSTVGQFISWDLLVDVFHWFISHPESGDDYVSGSALIKLTLIIAASTGVAIAATARVAGPKLHFVRLTAALGASATLLAALAAPFFADSESFATFPQRRAGLWVQVKTLFPSEFSGLVGLPSEEIYQRYNKRVNSPVCSNRSELLASEQGKDVIFFVYETAPRRSFDIALSRGWLPAIESIASQSIVADRHYSTYPYTSDALFSVFTGRYPMNRRKLIERGRGDLSTSLTQHMRMAGYEFRVYASYGDTFEADTTMFAALGAVETYVPDEADQVPAAVRESVENILSGIPTGSSTWLEETYVRAADRLSHDLAGFDRFMSDVLEMKRRQQRFAALYLPQIGHAPWFDFDGTADVAARGAAAMRIQDQWLEKLLGELRVGGYLENTVLVITADHGVRTKNEDPAFDGGTLSAYSFHVPLVIYAPAAAPAGRRIGNLTSHIDIAATIEALLDIPAPASDTQGVPIWCEDIDNRATFFFGASYLGADGYRLGEQYVMHEVLTDAVYQAEELDFSGRIPVDPADAPRHRQFIREISQLTTAWNSAQPRNSAQLMDRNTSRTPSN